MDWRNLASGARSSKTTERPSARTPSRAKSAARSTVPGFFARRSKSSRKTCVPVAWLGLLEHALNRPVVLVCSSGFANRQQYVVEGALVTGLFAQFEIGQQTEQRSPPIRAAPGPSVLQPFVTGSWQALRHPVDQVAPHFRLTHETNSSARDRFDVGRQALAQPAVLRTEVGEIGVEQLVRDDPIVVRRARVHAIRSAHQHSGATAAERDAASRFAGALHQQDQACGARVSVLRSSWPPRPRRQRSKPVLVRHSS